MIINQLHPQIHTDIDAHVETLCILCCTMEFGKPLQNNRGLDMCLTSRSLVSRSVPLSLPGPIRNEGFKPCKTTVLDQN